MPEEGGHPHASQRPPWPPWHPGVPLASTLHPGRTVLNPQLATDPLDRQP